MYDLRAAKIRRILFIFLSFSLDFCSNVLPDPLTQPPQTLLLYQPSTSVNAVYFVDGVIYTYV